MCSETRQTVSSEFWFDCFLKKEKKKEKKNGTDDIVTKHCENLNESFSPILSIAVIRKTMWNCLIRGNAFVNLHSRYTDVCVITVTLIVHLVRLNMCFNEL